MTDNLHDAAYAAWQEDYAKTIERLRNQGTPQLTALVLAQNEVTARRGVCPTLAKAIHDQGGPLAGQV